MKRFLCFAIPFLMLYGIVTVIDKGAGGFIAGAGFMVAYLFGEKF